MLMPEAGNELNRTDHPNWPWLASARTIDPSAIDDLYDNAWGCTLLQFITMPLNSPIRTASPQQQTTVCARVSMAHRTLSFTAFQFQYFGIECVLWRLPLLTLKWDNRPQLTWSKMNYRLPVVPNPTEIPLRLSSKTHRVTPPRNHHPRPKMSPISHIPTDHQSENLCQNQCLSRIKNKTKRTGSGSEQSSECEKNGEVCGGRQ
jgi:hypothetical protein